MVIHCAVSYRVVSCRTVIAFVLVVVLDIVACGTSTVRFHVCDNNVAVDVDLGGTKGVPRKGV